LRRRNRRSIDKLKAARLKPITLDWQSFFMVRQVCFIVTTQPKMSGAFSMVFGTPFCAAGSQQETNHKTSRKDDSDKNPLVGR
jgi:hypothetical protein